MIDFFKGNKIVVVVKRNTALEAIINCQNLIDNGIQNIEVTFNTPELPSVIKILKDKNKDILIGAGTTMTHIQAKKAIDAGADFIVSPGYNSKISNVCHENKVLYIPGVLTPTEIQQAINDENKFIKLFPSSFVGIDYVKALKSGPFPKLEFMPTAGVNKSNINDWFKAGASAVGMAGKMLTDNVEVIKQEIKEITNALKEVKNND